MSLATAYANAVAGYALDEASGNALDSIGANDLTQVGSSGSVTGQFSGARSINGASGILFYHANAATFQTGDIKFSLRCWVKINALGSTQTFICKGDIASASMHEFWMGISGSSNKAILIVGDGSGATSSVASDTFGALSAGTWYLIHATHDDVANQIAIAVNGQRDTASFSTGVHVGTGEFVLGVNGSHTSSDRSLLGTLDDVVLVKNYAMDASDITADWNSGAGVKFADWNAGGSGFLYTQLERGIRGLCRGLFGGARL